MKHRLQYSGIYTTFTGAQRAMKKRGFASMGDLFAKHLEEIAPAKATIGDVAVIELTGLEHSAICTGEKFLTRTQGGKILCALADVKAAFQVEN